MIPAERHGAAAAQDAVRREVRRPGDPRRARPSVACPRATSSPRTAPRRRSSSSRCSTTCCRCCRPSSPQELNATLNAFATALEGRGDRLGENLELVDEYFGEINPQMRADQDGHRRRWPTWPRSTPTRRRTWCDMLRNSLGHHRDHRREAGQPRGVPGRHRGLREHRPARCSPRTSSRIIRSARSAARHSAARPATRRSTRACCGLAEANHDQRKDGSGSPARRRRSPTASCTSPSRSCRSAPATSPGEEPRVRREPRARLPRAADPPRPGAGRVARRRRPGRQAATAPAAGYASAAPCPAS